MKTKYTFQNARYLTCGIETNIPIEIQIIIWNAIDTQVKEGKNMDYLLVVTFSRNKDDLLLNIRQEKPKRNMIYSIKYHNTYQNLYRHKIYVIDDLTHSTMLLAEEY